MINIVVGGIVLLGTCFGWNGAVVHADLVAAPGHDIDVDVDGDTGLRRGQRQRRQIEGAGGGSSGWEYIAAAPPPAVVGDNDNDQDGGWGHAARIVENLRTMQGESLATFPDVDFDIVQYGNGACVGDGITDCTEAIRDAVAACHAAGGGRVVVPPAPESGVDLSSAGNDDDSIMSSWLRSRSHDDQAQPQKQQRNIGIYLTGPIVLLSNVNLHVPNGATLRFVANKSAYLPPVRSRYEGVELMNYSPFIYAYEENNIAITGGGTLDGNADETNWWDWKLGPNLDDRGPERSDKKILFRMMEENVPVSQRRFGEGYHLRPNFIGPFRCSNVHIEDVTIINSPMWTIHPTFCTNVTVRGVTVDSPRGPNNDGCVVDSSQNVLIEDSYFNSGDDCVAVKSGRGDDGRRVGIASTNVVVRRCTMRAGHGGFVVGSEIAGGVRNVYSEDCDWDSPDLRYGLRIKSNRRWGGHAEGIYVRNIRIRRVRQATVRVNLRYQNVLDGPHTPQVRQCTRSGYDISAKPVCLATRRPRGGSTGEHYHCQ